MTTENETDDRSLEETRPDISALASTVISVLSDKSDGGSKSIRGSLVRKLVTATLRPGVFDAEQLLEDLKDGRVAADQIVDVYIPKAALELGVMWVEDEIGFAKVTIASARLQGLLTLLAPPWSAKPSINEDSLNTLLILQANDSHTLGPHVATAQLRRMGATVRLLFGPDERTVLKLLEQDHYDLIMFSCSRTDALASIAKMIKRIRSDMDSPPPIALGGLVLELADRVKDRTGADLVTADVRVAFKLCDKKRQKPRFMAR